MRMSTESTSTEVQEKNNSGNSNNSEPKEYKAITIRARANTVEFWERIERFQRENNLSTTEASNRVIAELLEAQQSTGDHEEKYQTFLSELEHRDKKIAELESQIKILNEVQANKNENAIEVIVSSKRRILFDRISSNRFTNPQIRNRYGLKEPESVGDLLMNCILTEEILMNHNDCFFTGLTREMLANHKS